MAESGPSSAPTRSTATQLNVSFLTDVEGNWEYFVDFIKRSDALSFAAGPTWAADGTVDLVLTDGWRFVFGGDVCDKGGAVGGTVRVVRSLLALKRKYPSRVTILLGNRDLNKMRLTSEMEASQLKQLDALPGPYWVAPAKRVTLKMFLKRQLTALKGEDLAQEEEEAADAELAELNTPANRLRYVLKETMGADGEFERRQTELAVLRGVRPEEVTDEEVALSFTESVQEGGFMREFIHAGRLAEVIGNTLYCHGGLIGGPWPAQPGVPASHCIGFVPGRASRLLDVTQWLDALEEWRQAELRAWVARPHFSEEYAASDLRGEAPIWPQAAEARGGHRLMHYVVPGCEPSVVMGRHLDSLGMPASQGEGIDEVASLLNSCGVTRLVVGHTPHGNCPTVMKIGGPREKPPCLEVIMADTSYSDMSAGDNRGTAVSEVQLLADGGARVHGVLQDGALIAYDLEPGVGPARELVGQLEPDFNVADGASRRFIKARLPGEAERAAEGEAPPTGGDGEYLLCHVRGFVTTYEVVSEERLDSRRMRGSSSISNAADRDGGAEVVPITHIHSHGDEACVGAPPEFYHMDLVAFLYSSFMEADTDGDASLSVEELRVALRDNPGFIKLVAGSDNEPPSADELITAMAGAGASLISLDMFASYCQNRQDNAHAITPREEARARTRQQVAAWFEQQEVDDAKAAGEAAAIDAEASEMLSRLQLVWMTTEQRAVMRLQRMFRARKNIKSGKVAESKTWPPRAADAAVAYHTLAKSVERLHAEIRGLAATVTELERDVAPAPLPPPSSS